MFFKRLSRGSRSNSYVNDDDNYEQPRDKYNSQQDSPRQSLSQHNTFPPTGSVSPTKDTQRPESQDKMYPHSQAPADPYARPQPNGVSGRNSIAAENASISTPIKVEAAPDLLTRAFNEAVRPFSDKIENLEGQVADLQAWVEQLEQQRAEVHSWIDKRGLRPGQWPSAFLAAPRRASLTHSTDVPPSIAKIMDAQPDAAQTLNAQLDRKITIVNFDLHRLQDDLNDSISSSHFASAMTKFLPDIQRLSSLPTGPRFAFDLILKLGGNLNSHGGLDNSDAADLAARRDFYAKLDQAMVEVVQRRFQENEEWPVSREIKRIEKTAAYLRNFGVEPYFPSTLDAMRREVDYRQSGPVPPQAQSPPRYQ
jgi:hypothetical protein